MKATKLAEQYALKYQYLSVDDGENLLELKSKMPNVKSVPQIWWNANYIGGYKDFSLEIENTVGNYGQDQF